jgi:cyclophilin family peptidyl-prolyl cis-trans isomerase
MHGLLSIFKRDWTIVMKKRELFVSVFAYWLVVPVIVAMLIGQFILPTSASTKKVDMSSKNPVVEMDTTKGVVKVEIFEDNAPITAKNFLDLVGKGFYNGLIFHRYEPGFCIQGGDPKGVGTGGYVDPATGTERRIPLEVTPKLRHGEAGMLAMARSQDPNSASSQFYFTLGPASFLDGQYAVFGKVVSGLDVVKELRKGDKMNKVFVPAEAHK